MLLFTLSICEPPENPRTAAWWGLLFPQMFMRDNGSEKVVFEWPLVMRVIKWLG